MTAWLPTSSRLRFADLGISRQAFAEARQQWRAATRNVRQVLSIWSLGLAAAHHYEQLQWRSDVDFAAKGLQRSDVPRAAFRKLTERF
jgi:hypothetical protein